MRVFVFAILVFWPALATAHPCQIGAAIEGRLVTGGTSDGFSLKGRDETFVLAGIVVNKVRQVQSSAMLRLYPALGVLDRYGRLPVFVYEGKSWMQADLLNKGRAVADPADLPSACADALLAAEVDNGLLGASDPEILARHVGRFVRVRGRVLSVGDREPTLYLNFGTNWSQDFTVSVAKKGRNRYQGNMAALSDLVGRDVTIRGLIEMRGGPLLRLTHEARLQSHN